MHWKFPKLFPRDELITVIYQYQYQHKRALDRIAGSLKVLVYFPKLIYVRFCILSLVPLSQIEPVDSILQLFKNNYRHILYEANILKIKQ